jgi:hypothetical protein
MSSSASAISSGGKIEEKNVLVIQDGKMDITLNRQENTWLDGKTAFEYHPDPLVFKATAMLGEALPDDPVWRENAELWCPRAFAAPHQEILNYLGLWNPKTMAKAVLYQRGKGKYGRAKPKDWFGMAVMMRSLRSTIWGDLYNDFDIENCHPSITLQLMRGRMECPALQHYCENRNEVLSAMMARHSITKDQAKQAVIAVFFGGSATKYFKDPVLAEMATERNGDDRTKGWARILKEANPVIYEAARQKNMAKTPPENATWKHMNTMVAWVLQEWEYRLFGAVFEWCEGAGLLTAPGVKELEGKPVFSYIYDGGCLLTSAVEQWGYRTGNGVAELCEIMRNVGLAATGLNVKWVMKQWEGKLDITEEYLTLKHRPRLQDLLDNPEMEREEYTRIWETKHQKITGRGLYVEEVEEGGEAIIRDRRQLEECYGHLWNGWTSGKNPSRINWLKTWLNNNHKIKSKDEMDIYPNPDTCPPNVYNLWVPFKLSLMKTWVHKPEAIEFFVAHIKDVMCPDGAPQQIYMLDWIAHMLQHPEVKVGKCPIFTSKPGAGKGRTIEFFKALLGEDKVYDPEKPERDVWGEFNGAMKNAFLVSLDELSEQKSTKAMGEFKHIITEAKISIRLMRTDPFKMRSFHRFIAMTNDEDGGVKIGMDDRRFWVNRASEKYRGNTEYWMKFEGFLRDKNAMKTVFEWFKEREIVSDFRNPEATPLTNYHKALVRENTPTLDLWMEAVVRKHWTHPSKGNAVLNWTAEDALRRYLAWCGETNNIPETEKSLKHSRMLGTRDYGLCGATSKFDGPKGKAMRRIDVDKMVSYFKERGVMSEEQFYAGSEQQCLEGGEADFAAQEEMEKADARIKQVKEQDLIAQVAKEMTKELKGQAKKDMFAKFHKVLKNRAAQAQGGEAEEQEEQAEVEEVD